MQNGFPRQDSNYFQFHQPIIDGSKRKQVVYETMRTLPKADAKHVLNSHGDSTQRSGSSHEMIIPLAKKDFCSRKDTARRNLMGYLYGKQAAVRRSNSFVAGERISSDFTVLPRLNSVIYRERTSLDDLGRKKVKMKAPRFSDNFVTENHTQQQTRNPVRRTPEVNRTPSGQRTNSRQGTQKINLPDLINDLNANVRVQPDKESVTVYSGSESDSDFQHDDKNAIGEDNSGVAAFLSKHVTKGGNIVPARHRPITPGLLDKLAKLRLPSRIRTEQWIRRLPSDPRSVLNVERIPSHKSNNSNDSKDETRWIYTNT